MSYESSYHHVCTLNTLNSHLYHLTSKANERLDRLTECGCFFCGRRNPPIVLQFLHNNIYRIPVCESCYEKGYRPEPEELEKHG